MKRLSPAVRFGIGATLAVLSLVDAGTTSSREVRLSASAGLVIAWVVCGLALHQLGREDA